MRVGRDFQSEHCTLGSLGTNFQGMRVDGDGVLTDARFVGDVSFNGAHFNNLFFNRAHFEEAKTIDFTRMQVDRVEFDGVTFHSGEGRLELNGITFKSISPANVAALRPLLLGHDPEFHATMQTWFRNHGSPDAADEIFFADKRLERREICRDFLHQCNRAKWTWSVLLEILTGYGRQLDRLLYFSMGFLFIGCFIFRKRDGMEIKNQKKDAPEYRGTYHPFWYSLDLFLPVIKLGEAEIWTPKYERRFAVFYKRLLMIMGALVIPVALGALFSK
jgi:hypothetical protein